MKKFQFRLQKVLEYRKKIEDEKKNELAKHISRYNQVQKMIDDAYQTKQEIIKNISTNLNDPTSMKLIQQSLLGISQTFSIGKKRLQIIQLDIDRARVDYIEARKQREVLEKLKEKALKKYKYEEKKKNEKMLEESAIRLWNKGKLREFEAT